MRQLEQDYRDGLDGLRFSDEVKEHMMKNLMKNMMKNTIDAENQNKKGKHFPVRAMLLAAALAVGCVLSIAAGLPAQVYNFMSGGTFTTMPGMGQIAVEDGEETVPIKAENGRLWFEGDGQKLDITDKVDENTPYIYERTDAATGEKGYVVVGGTVDNFGWVEIVWLDGVRAMWGDNYETFSLTNIEEDTGDRQPWFQAALDQLGMEN